jgi:hypothetical protein
MNSIKEFSTPNCTRISSELLKRGLWDKIRATTEKYGFRRQNHHKTKISWGTTEVVYRITLLDKTSKWRAV